MKLAQFSRSDVTVLAYSAASQHIRCAKLKFHSPDQF